MREQQKPQIRRRLRNLSGSWQRAASKNAGAVKNFAKASDKDLNALFDAYSGYGETAADAFLQSLGIKVGEDGEADTSLLSSFAEGITNDTTLQDAVALKLGDVGTQIADTLANDTSMQEAFSAKLGEIVTGLGGLVDSLGLDTLGEDMAKKVAEGFGDSTAKSEAWNAGVNMGGGFLGGLWSMAPAIIAAASAIARAAAAAMKFALKIHSPSKVTEEIGLFAGEGFVQGSCSFHILFFF